MVKLVDTPGLGPGSARSGGSTPSTGTRGEGWVGRVWLIALVLKTNVPLSVPKVRILHPPPN